jgi:hypothetical protein
MKWYLRLNVALLGLLVCIGSVRSEPMDTQVEAGYATS